MKIHAPILWQIGKAIRTEKERGNRPVGIRCSSAVMDEIKAEFAPGFEDVEEEDLPDITNLYGIPIGIDTIEGFIVDTAEIA